MRRRRVAVAGGTTLLAWSVPRSSITRTTMRLSMRSGVTSVRAAAALGLPRLEPPAGSVEILRHLPVEAVALFAELEDGVVEQPFRAADVLVRLVPGCRGAALRAGHLGRLPEEHGHRSTNIAGRDIMPGS